jgi:hypothetical protein
MSRVLTRIESLPNVMEVFALGGDKKQHETNIRSF